MFFSFNIGPVHFVSISTEYYYLHIYGLGLGLAEVVTQYSWLESDLGKVDRMGTGLGVVDDWVDIVRNIQHCRWQDAILGISCVIFLLSLRVIFYTSYQIFIYCDEGS